MEKECPLLEIPCLEEQCAWWNEDESHCSWISAKENLAKIVELRKKRRIEELPEPFKTTIDKSDEVAECLGIFISMIEQMFGMLREYRKTGRSKGDFYSMAL